MEGDWNQTQYAPGGEVIVNVSPDRVKENPSDETDLPTEHNIISIRNDHRSIDGRTTVE